MKEKELIYDYWLKVSKSIQQYINLQKNTHFIYNKINLKSAFAKYIYYRITSRTIIKRKIIDAILEGNKYLTITLEEKVVREILMLMYPEITFNFLTNHQEDIPKPKKRKITFSDKNITVKYLFIVYNIKFIKYLAPIYERLADSAFLLINSEKDVTEYCNKKLYQWIHLEYNDYGRINNLNEDISFLANNYRVSYNLIKKLNPQTIIVAEGVSKNDEIFNLVSKSLNIKSICVQHGWTIYFHICYKYMNYDEFLLWSSNYSKFFKKINNKQKTSIIGSYILNNSDTLKEKNSICFLLSNYKGSFLFNEKDHSNLLEFIEEYAKKNKNSLIIVREHPNCHLEDKIKQTFTKYPNIKLMHPKDYTLNEVFEKVEIAIGLLSTSMIEALAFNIIPISYNPSILKDFTTAPYLKDLLKMVNSLDDLKSEIYKIIKDNSYKETLLHSIKENKDHFFSYLGEESIQRVIKKIQ